MTNTNTSSNKLTYASAVSYVVENFADEMPVEYVEKLNALITSLSAKPAKKMSAKQEANIELGKTILGRMPADEKWTVSEIIKHCDLRGEDGNFLNTQRVTPILRALVKAEKFDTEINKGKAVYFLR